LEDISKYLRVLLCAWILRPSLSHVLFKIIYKLSPFIYRNIKLLALARILEIICQTQMDGWGGITPELTRDRGKLELKSLDFRTVNL
jgi:hypothetical protein